MGNSCISNCPKFKLYTDKEFLIDISPREKSSFKKSENNQIIISKVNESDNRREHGLENEEYQIRQKLSTKNMEKQKNSENEKRENNLLNPIKKTEISQKSESESNQGNESKYTKTENLNKDLKSLENSLPFIEERKENKNNNLGSNFNRVSSNKFSCISSINSSFEENLNFQKSNSLKSVNSENEDNSFNSKNYNIENSENSRSTIKLTELFKSILKSKLIKTMEELNDYKLISKKELEIPFPDDYDLIENENYINSCINKIEENLKIQGNFVITNFQIDTSTTEKINNFMSEDIVEKNNEDESKRKTKKENIKNNYIGINFKKFKNNIFYIYFLYASDA